MMDAPAFAPTSGISTVPHEAHGFAASRAEADAARTAERQAKGLPWRCAKLEKRVTNAECRELHAAGDYRACQICTIPNILPKEEGQDMATRKGKCPCGTLGVVTLYGSEEKGWWCYQCFKKEPWKTPEPPTPAVPASGEVVPSAPDPGEPVVASQAQAATSEFPDAAYVHPGVSWDDFQDVEPVDDRPCLVSIGAHADRLNLNAALQKALGWETKAPVEVRMSADKKTLALRLSPEGSTAKTYSLTAGGKSAVRAVTCKTALKAVGAQQGLFPVTLTPWGFIAHLDRPVEG
jgi:hypothetical protein